MWDAVDHLDQVGPFLPRSRLSRLLMNLRQGLQLIVCKVIAEKLKCFKTEAEARDRFRNVHLSHHSPQGHISGFGRQLIGLALSMSSGSSDVTKGLFDPNTT